MDHLRIYDVSFFGEPVALELKGGYSLGDIPGPLVQVPARGDLGHLGQISLHVFPDHIYAVL